MNPTRRPRSLGVVLLSVLALIAFASSAIVSHSWSNYHWALTSNPVPIKVLDSMISDWDDNLTAAIKD